MYIIFVTLYWFKHISFQKKWDYQQAQSLRVAFQNFLLILKHIKQNQSHMTLSAVNCTKLLVLGRYYGFINIIMPLTYYVK